MNGSLYDAKYICGDVTIRPALLSYSVLNIWFILLVKQGISVARKKNLIKPMLNGYNRRDHTTLHR